MMSDNQIDLAFVQEPYNIRNHLAGIPKSLRTYVSGDGRKRSALFVNNKEIDVVLITQFSDEDCIVAEISYRNTKCYEISLYFDITEDTEISILTFNLRMEKQDKLINNTDYVEIRYIIKNEEIGKFEAIVASTVITKFN
jgi:hypothetical protein